MRILMVILVIGLTLACTSPPPTATPFPTPNPTATPTPFSPTPEPPATLTPAPSAYPTATPTPIVQTPEPPTAEPTKDANPTSIKNAKRYEFQIQEDTLSIWVPRNWEDITTQIAPSMERGRTLYLAVGDVLPSGLFSDAIMVSRHPENPSFDLQDYIDWAVSEADKTPGRRIIKHSRVTFMGGPAAWFELEFISSQTGNYFFSSEVVVLGKGTSLSFRCLRARNIRQSADLCREILNSAEIQSELVSTIMPTLKPTATPTPEPTATATPEPTATLTPTPTATPLPTPTPTTEPKRLAPVVCDPIPCNEATAPPISYVDWVERPRVTADGTFTLVARVHEGHDLIIANPAPPVGRLNVNFSNAGVLYGSILPVDNTPDWKWREKETTWEADVYSYEGKVLTVVAQIPTAAATHPGFRMCLWRGGATREDTYILGCTEVIQP